MTENDILELLHRAHAAVHEQFPPCARLNQFASHLATVIMTVEHLFDESTRQ